MTEVRTSSLCERPCADIEETGEAPSDAGGMECSRRRKVHSLIDKVYDPANLAEAWKRVRENKGSAGIDGLTVAGFEQRQDELLERLHQQLREKTYRPSPVKRVAIPKLLIHMSTRAIAVTTTHTNSASGSAARCAASPPRSAARCAAVPRSSRSLATSRPSTGWAATTSKAATATASTPCSPRLATTSVCFCAGLSAFCAS